MKHIISSVLFLIVLLCLSVFIFDPWNYCMNYHGWTFRCMLLADLEYSSFALAVLAYKKKKTCFMVVISFYFCIAIGWESYEYVKDLAHNTPWNGWSDTLSDIINGAVGATVAYFLLKDN